MSLWQYIKAGFGFRIGEDLADNSGGCLSFLINGLVVLGIILWSIYHKTH